MLRPEQPLASPSATDTIDVSLPTATIDTLAVTVPQSVSHALVPISVPSAVKTVIASSASYTLSRLAPALNFIATAALLKQIGGDAVSSGAVLSTAYFAPIFIARGPIMVFGIALSSKVEINDYDGISSLMQSGYLATISVSIPIMALFASASKILPLMMDDNIADNASKYLAIATSGVTANLMLGTLQQFTLAVKQPRIALMSSTLTLILANGLAALLALHFKMGLQGMATGYAAAFILNLFGLIAYLKFKSEFAKFNIFDLTSFKIKKADMIKLFKDGAFISLQQICDPGNLFAISTMAVKLGTSYAIAQNTAMQLGSIYPTLATGCSQANAVVIGGLNGKKDAVIASGNIAAAKILTRNIKIIANTSIILTAIGGTIFMVVFSTAPKQLTTLFINSTQTEEPEIYKTSEHLLQITGLCMVFDSVRIAASGALRGMHDVAFPSIISTVLLNIFGLMAGGLLTLQFHKDVEYLFITRAAALLFAAIVIYSRLLCKIKEMSQSISPIEVLADDAPQVLVSPVAEEVTSLPHTPAKKPTLLTWLYSKLPEVKGKIETKNSLDVSLLRPTVN